jgi:type IV pilus assembly protein PilY1
MKKGVALLLIVSIVSLVALDVSPVLADDSDIFGANIQPNVMILFDSSGSMNNQVGTFIPYDPATTYCQPATAQCLYTYTSTVVYRRTSSGYSVYANTIADVPSASARSSLSSVGYWSGRIGGSRVNLFTGNYLNYQACSPCDGMEEKLVIAKRVVTNLINNTEGVRFGVMRFANNSSPGTGGAGMVAQIGTDNTTMTNAVNAINASGYTPLGEQMRDAGLYYEGRFQSYASPIQLECQPNFIILMTDGMQNGTLDVRTEAGLRFTQDHAGGPSPEPLFAGTQNVIVHTVGFSIDPRGVAERDGRRDGRGNVAQKTDDRDPVFGDDPRSGPVGSKRHLPRTEPNGDRDDCLLPGDEADDGDVLEAPDPAGAVALELVEADRGTALGRHREAVDAEADEETDDVGRSPCLASQDADRVAAAVDDDREILAWPRHEPFGVVPHLDDRDVESQGIDPGDGVLVRKSDVHGTKTALRAPELRLDLRRNEGLGRPAVRRSGSRRWRRDTMAEFVAVLAGRTVVRPDALSGRGAPVEAVPVPASIGELVPSTTDER